MWKKQKKEKGRRKEEIFQERWTLDYFFIENPDRRPLCLICNKILSDNKEYNVNVKQHNETKYSGSVYGKLDGVSRSEK